MKHEQSLSEIDEIRHWELIISAFRGSEMAKVWYEYKTGLKCDASNAITPIDSSPPDTSTDADMRG
jgi:hypothetical protein